MTDSLAAEPINKTQKKFLILDNELSIPDDLVIPEKSSSLNRIEQVYFEKNGTDINLVMKMPNDIDYLVYSLKKPNRIVVEVNDAEPGFLFENLKPIEPIVAMRYSVNENNRFKLVLESEQELNIKKSTTSNNNEKHDLVVAMEYGWEQKSVLEEDDIDSLSDIVDKKFNEEKDIVFKGELIKTPVNPKKPYVEKLFKQAYAQYKAGNITKSLRGLNEVLDHDDSHVNARSTLAFILSKQGHTDLAYSVLNEGLLQYPEQYEWKKMYARFLLTEGRLEEAREKLAEQLPDISNNIDYYGFYAAILQKLEQHNDSAKVYRDLLRINPLNSVWWMGLGISLESLRRYEDALYAYQKAYKNPQIVIESKRFLDQSINRINKILSDESA